MRPTPRLSRLVAGGLLLLAASTAGRAEDPKPGRPDAIEAIKPRPLAPIPDDPPPHEGAMVDIPLLIDPPDILIVEVHEALPGQPITGERLVRPDGSISL